MKCVLLILIILIISACTKIENDFVVPDSAPFKFKNLKSLNYEIKNAELFYYSFPDKDGIFDLLYQFVFYPDSQNKIIRAYSSYLTGYPYFDQDQTNFKLIDYENIKLISQVPIIFDFNKNGSMDEVFLIEYDNSFKIQLRDHLLPLNPKDKFDEKDDILRNYEIEKFDNCILRYLGSWKNTRFGLTLVFAQDNRIIRKSFKALDTLIFVCPESDTLFKLEIGVPVGFPNSAKSIYQSGENLILGSGLSKNGHNYGKFKDYNSYLFGISSDFKIKWYNILKSINEKIVLDFLYTDNEFTYVIKKKAMTQHSIYILELYNNLSSKLDDSLQIDFPDDLLVQSFSEINMTLYLYSNKSRLKIDKLTLDMKLENLPVGFMQQSYNMPYHNSVIYQNDDYLKYDFNDDKFPDILISNQSGQLVCLDGKDNSIIASSKKFDKPFRWIISRIQNNKKLITLYFENSSKSFLIEKNSLITRLQVHLSLFQSIGIIIILPVLFYFSYRFYLLSYFFFQLTNQNQIIGISLIKKENSNSGFKFLMYNRKILDLMGIKSTVSKNDIFSVIPPEIKDIISSSFALNKSSEFELTFYDDEIKYISCHFRIINPFFKTGYGILYIYDSTNTVKSEILKNALITVHDVKNELGVLQNRLDGIFYKLKKTTKNDEWINNQESSFDKSIFHISQSLKNLILTSRIEKRKMDIMQLDEVIAKWIDSNIDRFDNNDVNFIYELQPTYKQNIDIYYIGVIIQCALDNAVQALYASEVKEITIRTYSHNEINILEIIDTGCGMEKQLVNDITNSHLIISKNGTGFGIRLIQQTAKIHNAKMDIISELNKGTTLRITFNEIIQEEK